METISSKKRNKVSHLIPKKLIIKKHPKKLTKIKKKRKAKKLEKLDLYSPEYLSKKTWNFS